ncbi:hypothetical protein CHL76_11665 [Marinococcus halophilus]|uniref:Uncharacterized protein n=1 Tax=Marinococcus halophilus TaxID=1371 RepID=A0A510Y9N3_MARHA|nr:hypothetical protein CHL76_11665 [Marinococcus halophilus]GEK60075.1 hypothetical protein MHA01_29800 [Marinococcus halophilus]
MNGLSELNKTPKGIAVGLVQLVLPTITSIEDLQQQTQKVCTIPDEKNLSLSLILLFFSNIYFTDAPWIRSKN